MARPTVVSVSPSSGSVGVPTNVSISVTFDQEIDIYRLKNGGVFLEGPDESKTIGPSNIGLAPPETDEEEFLASPGLKGIKKTTLTFARVDGSGLSVNYYDYGDTSGAGELYRTKVTLTPDEPLAALTEYTVYIVGDEDVEDEYDFGLSTRTVFDTRKGANIGNGEAVFYGGYTGGVRQQFSAEIVTPGVSGVAEYQWWTTTDPIRRQVRTSTTYRPLTDGVKVKFEPGLNFEAGDIFTAWCDVPLFMDGALKYSFTTSDYEAATIPVSSTVLGGTGVGATAGTGALAVSETNPADRATFVSTTLTTITIDMTATVNPTTVTDSSVSIRGYAADGSVSGSPAYTDVITKDLTVADTRITITLDEDQLFENNIVVVTLDSLIADTDGNTLGSDYEFFFGTTLNPFYAGIRHVRLRLGSSGNYFPDETIAMAIWDASREVDAFSPPGVSMTEAFIRARTQFVVCYAAWILISSAGSITGSVRKRLGDFDVSRSEGSGSSGLDDVLKDCVDYYRAVLDGGGDISASLPTLKGVVKGDYDIDSPNFGRTWDLQTVLYPGANNKALYENSRRWYKTFLRRTSR